MPLRETVERPYPKPDGTNYELTDAEGSVIEAASDRVTPELADYSFDSPVNGEKGIRMTFKHPDEAAFDFEALRALGMDVAEEIGYPSPQVQLPGPWPLVEQEGDRYMKTALVTGHVPCDDR